MSKNRRNPKLFASFGLWGTQGSILGPILFNIFLNDLLKILKSSDVYKFADDDTISFPSKNRDTLLETLKMNPKRR